MLLYVNLDKKSQNSFINLVGISGDCTAFLSFKSFITFSKGPSEVSVFLKKLLLLVIPILVILISFPDSSEKMFSTHFILSGNRGFTVAQNFLLLMSFKFKFS